MTTPTLAAIVLSAGKGTRMKSEKPKVLHQLLGSPLGHYAVRRARELHAAAVVVVVGHGRADVETALAAEFGDGVTTAFQAEQRGTGHAAQIGLAALSSTTGTVLILYGDTPLLRAQTLRELVALQTTSGAPLAMLTMRKEDPTGYGRIVRDDEGRVLSIVEHKDASADVRAIDEVNPGIYAVDAVFLRDALAKLDDNNAQGELYLTDIVAQAAAHMSQDDGSIPTMEVHQEETLGVNDRRQLADAADILRRREIARLQDTGVTFAMPSSTYVEEGVTIGVDTVIGPFTTLGAGTILGARCTVDAGAVIRRSTIGDDTEILANSVVEDAVVGNRAHVGPFARLRPLAHLEDDVRVGNFVEVKKTRMHQGSKANHLAYLGDAEIGARANIGAGTITCNYDGHGKHLTSIGADVFIGSNSTLVAPVDIATGAYVAAGSTIAQAVPEGALAIARARQENKAGYADRIRARNKARKDAKAKA